MDETDFERLVPVGDVFNLLAQEHDRRNTFGDWERCKQAALQALLPRLLHGQLEAWASGGVSIDCDDPRAGPPGKIFDPMDFQVLKGPCKVDGAFWCNFVNAPETGRTFDPLTGDFQFDFVDEQFRSRNGHAFCVYLDRQGLPPVAIPHFLTTWEEANRRAENSAVISESKAVSPTPEKAGDGRGRRPANWWPDFAEELALYVLECGLPDGQGAQGQSEIIDAVFARMVEAGKTEPARTTVQPVISAILHRWRSAGNS